MNEEALRALVRDVIARHVSTGPRAEWAHHHTQSAPVQPCQSRSMPLAWHFSHARYGVLSGADSDGPCFIEPAVRCNHCGYCQSHGH